MENTAKSPEQMIKETISLMLETKAALQSCKVDDHILRFPNNLGLCVTINGKGNNAKIGHAHAHEATSVSPTTPIIIKNGLGEQAKVIKRQAAIIIEIKQIEDVIASLTK